MEDQEEKKLDKGNSTEGNESEELSAPSNLGPLTPQESSELSTARTLATVGAIGAPVSLLIGGVALSTVSLVCSIIALVKLRKFADRPLGDFEPFYKAVRLMALVGIGVGCGALVLNIIGIFLMVPLIMEAMATGDYSTILGGDAQSLLGGSSSSNTNPWG